MVRRPNCLLTIPAMVLLSPIRAMAAPAPTSLPTTGQEQGRFEIVEASIQDLSEALTSGRITSEWLVHHYLDRIRRFQPRLQAAVSVDAKGAMAMARRLDRERARGHLRGPLHGIPIALKDVIQTSRLPTTGGALAFSNLQAPREATLVRKLKQAGAIILAKTTLTELGNWVSDSMPNGYNALKGHSYNPYDSRRDPRLGRADGRALMDTGGSSSGIGTAASLWAANVGAETSGSLQIPALSNSLVAIKPTVGRISRHGIMPITLDQDTPGPMSRSVRDAAMLLGVMEGHDPSDPASGICEDSPSGLYLEALRVDGLKGKRIGIPRAYFYDPLLLPGDAHPRGGLDPQRSQRMDAAITILKQEGAVVVEPADLPSIISTEPGSNVLRFPLCISHHHQKGGDHNCSIVLKYGMKRDFNSWLAQLGPSAPVRDLTELRQFNLDHRARAIPYGQTSLDISDQMSLDADAPRYRKDRARDLRLSRDLGIDAALRKHQLDALLVPGWSAESIVNKAGYPAVVVPYGTVLPHYQPPLPAGTPVRPQPYGMTLIGTACSEAELLEMAYAFEQAAGGRVEPALDHGSGGPSRVGRPAGSALGSRSR
jgi:amidase